ncbi:TRAM, LAG1 and CLN8 (TLC) lipid-sensing domain containing protein [Thalictrum thalictroides]|uniref:TRAM, LAG1 and CLN8 (TLC) lipid-sensing domain containing protein n=1 Tax=Thalictrum thalictroides TaxID=46969 RepID=A0A7J6V0I7_THATH|nr:TRAM, LAG1 and CLN8 (TLC) lipid-sensing domain containing protein [Thalictrum thalictroides]
MYLHFDQVKMIFPLGFYSLLVVPPVLSVMNVVWFWKIAKGLVKTLAKAKHGFYAKNVVYTEVLHPQGLQKSSHCNHQIWEIIPTLGKIRIWAKRKGGELFVTHYSRFVYQDFGVKLLKVLGLTSILTALQYTSS